MSKRHVQDCFLVMLKQLQRRHVLTSFSHILSLPPENLSFYWEKKLKISCAHKTNKALQLSQKSLQRTHLKMLNLKMSSQLCLTLLKTFLRSVYY